MICRVIALVLLLTTLATSSSADDAELCADEDTEVSERVAACERAVSMAPDRPAALVALGVSQLDADLHALSVSTFTQALTLDVDRPHVFGRRAVAYGHLDQFELAKADLESAIGLEPDGVWYQYRLGWTLNQMRRYDEAIDALGRATQLDPDYFWSWMELATAHDRMNNRQGAALAYHEAARIRPFRIDIHNTAHYRASSAELLELAAYHARVSYVLNPNQLSMRNWLLTYLGERASPNLPPLVYAEPDPDQAIRYFSVRAPVDQRDDVTKSIEDLIVFFGGSVYPVPDSAAVQRISYGAPDGDRLLPLAETEKSQVSGSARTDPMYQFRGLFSLEVQPLGPGSPVIVPQFEQGDITSAWPLENGQDMSGAGKLVIICANSSGMPAVMMGCRPDLEQSDLGAFTYELTVTTETIHVPMGIFDTYRLDFIFEGEVTILGKTNTYPYSASYWVAPELNTWVQRIFTVEDVYVFHQALELVSDG